LFTSVKAVKGTPEVIKQRELAANNLFSTAISKIRQPIESLFNWLIEKINMQNVSKVRSTNGLLLHCFGEMAIAALNFCALIRIRIYIIFLVSSFSYILLPYFYKHKDRHFFE
jgi:hypothetical protein